MAHYPTPGLLNTLTLGSGPIRGIWLVPGYIFYVVSGSQVWRCEYTGGPPLAPTFSTTLLGSITAGKTTPVSMADNGLDLVIVDGTYDPTFVAPTAWSIHLATDAFSVIPNGGFFVGADRVDYLDGYFIFNQPFSQTFWISQFMSPSFDPLGLDFAAKITHSDLLITLIVSKRLVYLFGSRMTEIWYNAGATDIGAGSFPFAEMQSEVIIDHGILAKYTPAVWDNKVYWLAISRAGHPIVMEATGYQTKRVSTYAIENHFSELIQDDAIGFVAQYLGHAMYVLTFPTADQTWVYDITTGLWHEWLWLDPDGNEHRHRAMSYCSVGGIPTVGDWENGKLYALNGLTDDGQPIKRQRSFPHLLADGRRVFYREFIADMETGNVPGDGGGGGGGGGGTSYGMQLVEIAGLEQANTSWGFPANTAFTTFLMSYWMCGPYRAADGLDASPSLWPSFVPTQFVGLGPTANTAIAGSPFIALTNMDVWAAAPDTAFYTANIPNPLPTSPFGCLLHIMMSVDTVAQTVQVYINDQPVTITGATWHGSPPYYFKVNNIVNIWQWGAGPFSGFPTRNPAIGDVWMANPPAFVDLSVTANRRKFISAGMTPVDLGATGTLPFGYQPAMYMSVRPGGAAADILNNLGVGGGTWNIPGGPAPAFQPIGACGAIPAPPPVEGGPPPECEICLDWSNDRGHTFGVPVCQPMNSWGWLTSLQWQRLGMARDRVFRLTWTCADPTALQGAWIAAITGDEHNEMAGQGAQASGG